MSTREKNTPLDSRIAIDRFGLDALAIRLSGVWRVDQGLPSAEPVIREIESRQLVRGVTLEDAGISGWDSGLLIFLIKIVDFCSKAGIPVTGDALPEGVRRLLALAKAVPARTGAEKISRGEPFFFRVGSQAVSV